MPLSFEQQPRESNKAFAAFRAYLELGPERSLVAAAEKVGKSKTLMEKWSRKFDWLARVQAHAAHVGEVERKAIQGLAIEKAVEWHQKHETVRREAWQEAEKTIALVHEARERWLKSSRVPRLEEIARVLELVFKLKQFATGMPSEIKEINTTMKATVDVDWEIAIRKAYGQTESGLNSPAAPAGTVVDVEEVRSASCEVRTGEQGQLPPTGGEVQV